MAHHLYRHEIKATAVLPRHRQFVVCQQWSHQQGTRCDQVGLEAEVLRRANRAEAGHGSGCDLVLYQHLHEAGEQLVSGTILSDHLLRAWKAWLLQ